MKALFIGGTGVISSAISRLAVDQGWELYLLNRGTHTERVPAQAHVLRGDIGDETTVARLIADHQFDVVADFIAYAPEQIERDLRLFAGRCRQYIFISSASAYQKPLAHHVITESTPLANPFWEYSRNKIACEDRLVREYRENGFPITIVRPSHTYDETKVPVAVHGAKGSWQVLERIRRGKPVLVHGDGSSLWTLTHADDLARAFVGIMGNPHALGEAVHITSDESLTWDAIYDTIGGALGMEVSKLHVTSDFIAATFPAAGDGLLGDKAHSVVFDNSKIKRLVPGWEAQVRFDQGVRRALDHILAHPDLQPLDPEFDAWCDRVTAAQRNALQTMVG